MSDRLTKDDWLRQGLRTLANEGPNALKVGPMSTRLNVSRAASIGTSGTSPLRSSPPWTPSGAPTARNCCSPWGSDGRLAARRATFLYWALLGQASSWIPTSPSSPHRACAKSAISSKHERRRPLATDVGILRSGAVGTFVKQHLGEVHSSNGAVGQNRPSRFPTSLAACEPQGSRVNAMNPNAP